MPLSLTLYAMPINTLNIIGCGPSGSLWPGTGESLGVNDSWKFGKPTDYLLCIDWPKKFGDRFKTIQKSRPKKFYTQLPEWTKYVENIEMIHLRRWKGYLEKGKINHSLTSPFVAISLAWNLGYKDLVLWGVDMNADFEKGYIREEISNFKDLTQELKKQNVNVYLGAEGSSLNFLPIWNG